MVHNPRIRVKIPDISKAVLLTVKQGDKDVWAWSTLWYSLASDGTAWHDALQQAQLSGPIARRVETLSLHHFDVGFCERILEEHRAKFIQDYSDLSLALWIAVATKFMSCFGDSKARQFPLDPKKVFGSNSTAFQDFKLLLALRNKHVVHDENGHYAAAAFAWLEPNGDVRGVGPMIGIARIDPTHVSMMRKLVKAAQDYIHVAIEDAGKALLAKVQAMSPEERATLPKGIVFPKPTVDAMRGPSVAKGGGMKPSPSVSTNRRRQSSQCRSE